MIRIIHNFLSDEEIERVRKVVRIEFVRSTIVSEGEILEETEDIQDLVRTSSTAYIQGLMLDNIGKIIKRKASILSGYPESCIEPLQVVKYKKGEKYDPHYDTRDRLRFTTVLIYLNDITDGSGHTVFPELNLSFQPKKGSAIYWHNLEPDGTLDEKTLHAGLPLEGDKEKILINVWIRHSRALKMPYKLLGMMPFFTY